MTGEEERALLREYLETCDRLNRGFQVIVEQGVSLMPMTADRIDALSIAHENVILAFLKRFEQFEDALNRTLKLISRAMEHGRIERLTSVDVTNRAYALGILESRKVWEGAVRARNALAHEYPMNPHKRADQLNTAWDQVTTLGVTFEAIRRFVDVEGLLA